MYFSLACGSSAGNREQKHLGGILPVLAVAVLISTGFGTSVCLFPGWGRGGGRTPSQPRLQTLGNYKSFISFLELSTSFFFFFPFDEVTGSETLVSSMD